MDIKLFLTTDMMYKMSASALLEAQRVVQVETRLDATTMNVMDADMNLVFSETISPARFLVQLSKLMDSYINNMVKTFDLGLDNDEHVSEDLEGVLLLEAYQNMEVTLEEAEDLWPEHLWPAAAPAADPAVNPASAPPLSMTLVPVRAPPDYYMDIVSQSKGSDSSGNGDSSVPAVIKLVSFRFDDFVYVFLFLSY